MLFGRTKAKVALAVRERLAEQRDGKYIVSLSRVLRETTAVLCKKTERHS